MNKKEIILYILLFMLLIISSGVIFKLSPVTFNSIFLFLGGFKANELILKLVTWLLNEE